MKNCKIILAVSFIIFITNFVSLFFTPLALGAVVNIDQIVFTTEPQSVELDTISTVLTIQTQNSDGVLETLDETADLTVSVDSATGQFNSNSTAWNPATTFTMSKNTGNKNFYYKDTAVGQYTITATLTTRTTGKSWTATQVIAVGQELTGDAEEEEEVIGEVAGAATSTNSESGSSASAGSSSSNSTHSSQENLSDLPESKSNLKINIGRDRTVFVGVPVEFDAYDNTTKNPEDSKVKFSWSFGDGSSVRGAGARHVYMYPGEYNVTVNAENNRSNSTTQAVARVKIRVLSPALILSKAEDNSISIKNTSREEVNLSGYSLYSTDQKYSLPPDTIISAGKTIIFPKEYIGFSYQGNEVMFLDSLGRKLFSLI